MAERWLRGGHDVAERWQRGGREVGERCQREGRECAGGEAEWGTEGRDREMRTILK